ncbi:hypothetical protein AYI68_g4674 [Smittium mucronatum]|uniref:Uncharacterized protein n=1 Tax=Smittium mucronatum TaxID=133383 RepID=A0A1R0GWF0_9FUNG|nr:hypothetical protein AYI68_g4674 [Smittium mucronatum]
MMQIGTHLADRAISLEYRKSLVAATIQSDPPKFKFWIAGFASTTIEVNEFDVDRALLLSFKSHNKIILPSTGETGIDRALPMKLAMYFILIWSA